MSTNTKLSQCKQHRIKKLAQSCNFSTFFGLLTTNALQPTLDRLLPKFRDRHYSPTETLSLFIAQALNSDRSCQKAVNDLALQKAAQGLQPASTSTGGYCRARQRLPQSLISELVCRTSEVIDRKIPEQWRWKGRRVHLIDGTSLTMPDTITNQAAYPKHKGQKPGLGFPICRLLGVFCLSSGAISNAALGKFNGKGSDEQTLLRQVMDTFKAGDLVVGDAFFGTYFFLDSLRKKKLRVCLNKWGCVSGLQIFVRERSWAQKIIWLN